MAIYPGSTLFPGPTLYPMQGSYPMPATALNVQTSAETGTTLAAAVNGDNTNGNSYANTGKQIVILTNTAGTSATCTVAFGYTVRGQTIPALSISVGANATVICGPYDPAVFGTTVTITPSASTLKPAVIQAP